MVAGPVSRFDVYLVALDPTVGGEIQKTRPCLVVSPDEMTRHIATVIVAPMTTQGQPYPSRVPCRLQGQDRWVVLDQLRTVDKGRLGAPPGAPGRSGAAGGAGRPGGDVRRVGGPRGRVRCRSSA